MLKRAALRTMALLAFLTAFWTLVPGQQAKAALSGDFNYMDNGDGTAVIKSYMGTNTDVIIPNVLEGLTVTEIGKDAFLGRNLTSVTLPDTLTSIGMRAFGANRLTSLTIPDSVMTIGDYAFRDNRLASLTLSNGLKSIGIYAFAINHLTSVILPEGLEYLADAAFRSNQLTHVTFPNSMTGIGSQAFRNNQIISVKLPDHLESIGSYAFTNNKLTNLEIPESVTSIAHYAFTSNALIQVTIPGDATSIGTEAFVNNQASPDNLTFISYDPSPAKDYADAKGHTFHKLNPELSGLTLSEGSLSPAFAAGSLAYTASVTNSVYAITVTPTASYSTFAITVNDDVVTSGHASPPIALHVGDNTIAIEVTTIDSTTRSYTIDVTRAPSSDASEDDDSEEDSNGEQGEVPAPAPVIPRYDMTLTTGDNESQTLYYEQKDLLLDVVEADSGEWQPAKRSNAWTLTIPVQTMRVLEEYNPEGVVRLRTPMADYDLPVAVLSEIDTAEVSGTKLTIRLADSILLRDMEQAAAAIGARLAGVPAETKLAVMKDDGERNIDRYADYVAYTLALADAGDPSVRIGVRYDRSNQTYHYAPSRVEGAKAAFQSRSGGIAAVLVHEKAFADVKGLWSEEVVNRLGTKLIVNGMDDTRFAPDAPVTRAEMTAMLVRSLGLQAVAVGVTGLKDVDPASWYADAVVTAFREGLVHGDETGRFRPDDRISREEAAVMIVSGMRYAVDRADRADDGVLTRFRDAGELSPWAKDEMYAALQAGLIEGSGNNQLLPKETTTRAVAAAMLDRMLRKIGFID
ncbi:S-layer homology domain-containing protein [Paenibacillus sp. UNCCL117]|uniref:leucine-rich repeat protein n=1 Tax=unclassified Paenibacillus TaxID=185978 RepID=UPI00087F77FA|nr:MULTISPECIES: leucine-rich repeat protein [unclassified Paenibacillus]SDD84644.1 S-layer homology domain-containing protein [Paenibacillus sp. cl123]SFW54576.1 S-layer homology domain-containing protein [Paenibacillus sp. UNCCL117]